MNESKIVVRNGRRLQFIQVFSLFGILNAVLSVIDESKIIYFLMIKFETPISDTTIDSTTF